MLPPGTDRPASSSDMTTGFRPPTDGEESRLTDSLGRVNSTDNGYDVQRVSTRSVEGYGRPFALAGARCDPSLTRWR